MQCAKQPEGSVLCGHYACAYLRACKSYSQSWRQLKKSVGWWKRKRVDNSAITQTVADICKVVTDECCYVDRKFFNDESELGTEEKYLKLRNWRTYIDMNDYKLSDLFE